MTSVQVSVIIEKDENGYFAYAPNIQGAYTQGSTYEEAIANMQEVLQLCAEDDVKPFLSSGSIQSSISLTQLPVFV